MLKAGVISPTRIEPPATVLARGVVNSSSNCPVPWSSLTSLTVTDSLYAGVLSYKSITVPCLNTETAAPNCSSN